MSLKQAIVVRADLRMGKGKIAAQSSHASLAAYKIAAQKTPKQAEEWSEGGAEKIVLKVSGEKELRAVYREAIKARLPAALIIDAGHTQIPAGTTTAVAIGPAEEEKVDEITGELKLL